MAATASGQGYVLVLVNGTLTVDPATLTITADDARRRYGAANPSFAGRIDGFLPGDDTSHLDGTLTFATGASAASPVGAYAITPPASPTPAATTPSPIVPGTLTVDPAPLTVTAIDTTPALRWHKPGLPARYDGFVLGEDANALAGTLAITTPAAPAPGRQLHPDPRRPHQRQLRHHLRPRHPHRRPAPLTITATDATPHSTAAPTPPFTARYDGFVLDEMPATSPASSPSPPPATAPARRHLQRDTAAA